MTDLAARPAHPPFDTVLVANRGEIACRVIRTLRAMGIRSVAIFSDADADARHVREADVAIRVGPAAALESYLSIEAVLAAARESGADAIHPGYGFLSENQDFAHSCADAGVVFIGPPASAIEAMADKIRAKDHVAARGVPVTPGAGAAGMSDDDLVAAAEGVGYPLIIKPSGGGGGKGMTVVTAPEALPDALRSARRVARGAFDDDTLLLERFITRPRHIEVQVLADSHGTVVHLGERECSLQRRHQKVMEEAPSPLLDEATRGRIGEAACEVARSVDYRGAGTVEFLVSDERPDEFFFMEMNTRLQVEHPVTELVTGIDLVEQQLRIAAGERLDLPPLTLRGHAVEARLYAEDPGRGFLPSTGTVLSLHEPTGEGVRVDSALVDGLRVGSDYDPMLGKIIAHGPDRATALARLDAALADTVVLGLDTNLAFLRDLIALPEVVEGRLDTGIIDRAELEAPAVSPEALALAAVIEHARAAAGGAAGGPSTAVTGPWTTASGWRLGEHRPAGYDIAGHRVSVSGSVSGSLSHASVRVDDGDVLELSVDLDENERSGAVTGRGTARMLSDGCSTTAHWARDERATWVHRAGLTSRLARRTRAEQLTDHRATLSRAAGVAEPELRTAMPGAVVAVGASTGDSVVEGQSLVTVEAMKMEHSLLAPIAGTVTITVAVGDQVRQDQVIARIDPHEGNEPT